MSELEDFSLLDAQQELTQAREIEALEIAHWKALLSYRPALGPVETALEPRTPECAAEIRQRCSQRSQSARLERPARPAQDQDREAAARRLRELDVTREGLRTADAAVRRAFAALPRAQGYLTRLVRARKASQLAKDRFVTANLRLVIAMAKRYDHGLLPLADLIQEGNLGLIRAVERFDYRRGHRFSTYASWWIRHGLNRALSDKARLVRIPVHALDNASKLARATQRIAVRSAQTPDLETLASELDISADKLALLRSNTLLDHPVSFEAKLSDTREQTLHDLLATPDAPDADAALELSTWQAELPELLAGLTSFEATILRFRFGLNDGEELTLREIGDRHNLSRERIRQIQAEALSKLRIAVTRLHPDHAGSGVAACA